jgi:hypothetical protein
VAFALTLLSGPVLMAVLAGLGMALGYTLGFIGSCIVLPIIAIVLGIRLGRATSSTTALLAIACAILVGIGSAAAYRYSSFARRSLCSARVAASPRNDCSRCSI